MELSAFNLEMSMNERLHSNQAEKMDRIRENLSPDSPERAAKAAIDFEAMLIKQMLSAMTKSLDGEGFFGSEAGSAFYQDMFLNQVSQTMAKDQSFGLAESILRQINPEAIEHLNVQRRPSSRLMGNVPEPRVRMQEAESRMQEARGRIQEAGARIREAGNRIASHQAPHNDDVVEYASQPHSEEIVTTQVLTPTVVALPRTLMARLDSYEPIITRASQRYNVDKNLIRAVIAQESYGNPNAVSPVGAKGLMQLMDGTARDLGVTDSFDPEQNIMGGTRYLRRLMNMFEDKELALAAYNAGQGNVRRHGGVPPFRETQNYIRRVMNFYNNFSSNGADLLRSS